MGSDGNGHKPTVYGTPAQFAELVAAVHKVAEAEPDETFADELVREVSHELVTLLLSRQAATNPLAVGFLPDGTPDIRQDR